jgi:RNA recognition motif-containing protein
MLYAGVAIVMKRLFVGNLPYNTTDEDLQNLFSGIGEVGSARVICDRETGRSRGFGFVEVEDAAVKKAITELSDTDFGGRKIRVSEAHEREQRERAYSSR